MGELLRTTCSPDEVCLSDSVPEVGEKYPNRQLEVILRTTVTPQVKLSNGKITNLNLFIYFSDFPLSFM